MKDAVLRLAARPSAPLATLFLFYALLVVGVMSIQVPPFQNPDEHHHMLRAEQLSRLGMLPRHLDNGATGAPVDGALVSSALPFLDVAGDPGLKLTRGIYDATTGIGWAGWVTPVAFGNTVIYPPGFYVPAVAAIWVGKGLGVSVVHTVYMARLANGICATVLAALAILLADAAAPWLLALLSLPMSLSLFSAVSQDGLMIACAALAAAVIGRSARGPVTGRRFVLLCLLLAAIGMARPPYAPLACLLLLVRWRGLPARLAGLALVGVAVAGWSLLALKAAGPDSFAATQDFDPARQLGFALHHPGGVVMAFWHTLARSGPDYLRQMVGRLGTMDVPLPEFVYRCAWAVLALSLAYAAVRSRHDLLAHKAAALFVPACCTASILLILFFQFLTFSPVGWAYAEGVQGRYFIEVLLFLAAAFHGPGAPSRRDTAVIAVLMTPCLVVFLALAVRATLVRFYL